LTQNIHDKFEEQYFNKLWQMLPAVYRTEDEDPHKGSEALGAFVGLIARQAAILQRSIDRLWEDEFITTCDDWIIPYIADLVGTNLVIEGETPAWRRDVANTIFYRRRKGTLAVLEEIAYDITGWNAKVVEFFKRLERNRHLLDPTPPGLEGKLSNTGIGGYADLRNVSAGELRGTAFDEYFYTPDVRLGRGMQGWYNIPKIGVFLYRLSAYPIEESTPFETGAGQFAFDPSGREITLFAAGEREQKDLWISPEEPHLPTPIRCRLLAERPQELYAETEFSRSLAIFENGALVPVSEIQAANLNDWSASASGKRFLIDPERGLLKYDGTGLVGDIQVSYHYGFSGNIGAGPYERRLTMQENVDETAAGGGNALQGPLQNAQGIANYVITIDDNGTYTAVPSIQDIQNLTVQAVNQKRPYLILQNDWTLSAAANTAAELRLDGIYVSGGYTIILVGDYELVAITHCTFDPGGVVTDSTFEKNLLGDDLKPTSLIIQGHVKKLLVNSSILGAIKTDTTGVVEQLEMCDSILQSVQEDLEAIDLWQGDATLNRCTILGRSHFHRLYASEVIFYGTTIVDNQQDGCLRFSAWVKEEPPRSEWESEEPPPDYILSELPRKYESLQIEMDTVLFASTRFGDPDYVQLLQSAPKEIHLGASDGSEMGAFSSLKNSIKERSLLIKYNEYMPVGVVPVIIYAT
jgi:hypothetical protein